MSEKSRTAKPLIHCITNPIAMNQSANAILALGARPIMAEHPSEVAEITLNADGLLLNFGNISDIRISAMERSIDVANHFEIPVVIDAVGVACSRFRMEFFWKLTRFNKARVIKGNYSEILALHDRNYKTSGVDADAGLQKNMVEKAAIALSEAYDAIIVATGKEDIVAHMGQARRIVGGSEQLGTVTGTGCMLGAIIATFLAFDNSREAVEKACEFFKECGRKAQSDKGSGTFMVNLMDRIGDWDGF